MDIDIIIYVLVIISFIGVLSVYVSERVSFNIMCTMRGYSRLNEREFEDIL
jgi:hypothetical protein